jgi:hypothetical protein
MFSPLLPGIVLGEEAILGPSIFGEKGLSFWDQIQKSDLVRSPN